MNDTYNNFFDSRDKYLSFVRTTDEKLRCANYLGRELQKMPLNPKTPFCLLDAGTGDGTVIATILPTIHKHLPKTPIIAVGKEISIDDINILLSYLPDRFAEHKKLVFHITNLSYHELANISNIKVKHITKELKGDTSHDFGLQLFNMSDFVQKNWALELRNGKLTPNKKIILTLYRRDQKTALKKHIPLPSQYQFIIASQAIRLRRPLSEITNTIIAPLLRMIQKNGRMVLIYSSGRDFSKPLLKLLYPTIKPYANTTPKKLLTAIQKLPEFSSIRTRIDSFKYGFINLFLGRSHFSLGNIISLWKSVTYVGQLSDSETVPLNGDSENKIRSKLEKNRNIHFVNNVIVFKKWKDDTIA